MGGKLCRVATVSALLVVSLSGIASAAWQTVVIRNPNAPAALTRCQADADYVTAGGTLFSAKVAVLNRTVHQLITFEIKLQYSKMYCRHSIRRIGS